jgi:hypothetical protein
MVAGDCFSVALSAPEWRATFDRINTSNVCDYVGIENILLSCRPLISETGTLFTKSMTHHAFYNNETAFLAAHLIECDAELWPSLYGWHCRRHEKHSRTLYTEWPLVSIYAPIVLEWHPHLHSSSAEDKILRNVVHKMLSNANPPICMQGTIQWGPRL